MGSRAARLRAWLPAAAGGLVAGHFLTYLFIAPAGPHRAAFLRQTGHGYFPKAVAVAAALSAIAMGAAAARGAARRHVDAQPLSWRPLWLRLAIVQALGFVALEIVERLVIGAPLGGLVSALPVGFVVETIVAGSVAWLLCLTERASETIVRALARRRVRRDHEGRAPLAPVPIEDRIVLRFFGSSATSRGPPAASFA